MPFVVRETWSGINILWKRMR